MKNYILTLLVSLYGLVGCLSSQTQKSQSKTNSAEFDYHVVQCLVPQGNGGNWPATLGWMSEQLAERVREAERSRKNVGFYLGCMAGGSSGSVATNVYMNILSNEYLIENSHVGKIFTIEETKIIVEAIRFLGLSLNLTFSELAKFWSTVISSRVGSRINNISIVKSIARKVFGDKSPKWWTGESVNPDVMMVDYALVNLLAKNLRRQDLKVPVKNYFNKEETMDLNRSKVKFIQEISEYPTFQLIPEQNSVYRDQKDGMLIRRSEIIGDVGYKRFIKMFNAFEYRNRYRNGVLSTSRNNILKRTIDTPMKEGFCAIAMGALHSDFSKINVNKAPNYKDQRPLVMCSRETIDHILSSPLYQKHIADKHPFASRFVLLEVGSSRASMYASIREPRLMREFAGKADSKEMEFRSFYDPQDDILVNGKHLFKRRSTNMPSLSASRYPVLHIAVAGGFPDRRISAWMLTYYLDYIKNKLGDNTKAYFSMFGKPDKRSRDKFDTTSIKEVFSESPEDGARNVADWFTFQDSWCETFLPNFRMTNKEFETVVLNWDVTKLPASQARKSHYLVTKAINATRFQIAATRGEDPVNVPVVFDPNKNTLPVLTYSIPCIP